MEIVVVIGAIAVSVLVFTLMLKVVKATLQTALVVAVVLLVLQLAFGIGPGTIVEQIQQWIPGQGTPNS
ncbi:MAG: hypothetical protein AAF215_23000 [Cyanobacteria bacterium P01_A01_bin.123]